MTFTILCTTVTNIEQARNIFRVCMLADNNKAAQQALSAIQYFEVQS